ncbi:uncharacterized protein RCO7_05954 [Rhynchosporium graminicola]|uniref:Uncharacterized protein n=1 Tax=Rhynchosporium graminicola TaxID=2792576 RepID=A0A1E1KX63_9HELO|nr:uncharacterized protein RCO7_05954 [Rhynchosporium commune]
MSRELHGRSSYNQHTINIKSQDMQQDHLKFGWGFYELEYGRSKNKLAVSHRRGGISQGTLTMNRTFHIPVVG